MKKDPYKLRESLPIGGRTYDYLSLKRLALKHPEVLSLPYSIRVLLENALHHLDDFAVRKADIEGILSWKSEQGKLSIPFCPARVLMQDFTGVPAVVDLASMRDEMSKRGGNPSDINPLVPVDLVIDHSVQVEFFGSKEAYARNVAREYEKNHERYQLLKWAQNAFHGFRVVPPGMGICHQVNIEYLAEVIFESDGVIFSDTLVGTDSHTPMVNALGVLGWGVGGIEAEAAMLGQPLYMLLPAVVGLRLEGMLSEGATATDLVLHITEVLRKRGVVGKFVEVFGPGVDTLPVTDRATISNMSPEFGCTDTHWPIDQHTLDYLHQTCRSAQALRVESYAKENLLWRDDSKEIAYSEVIEINLGEVAPAISGPKRPQDKILLREAKQKTISLLEEQYARHYVRPEDRGPIRQEKKLHSTRVEKNGQSYLLSDASIVIAAITSCTNTSNPNVMIGAGLLAQNAVTKGLTTPTWVKTSLAPGSRVVTRYLKKAGLLAYLEALNFHIVGYGCTTCIGNSGDMPNEIQRAVDEEELVVAAVLSGNRNFEARIHPQVQMNFLASPLLVVAYALAGRMDIDMYQEPLGKDKEGKEVFLRDIWPTQREIAKCLFRALSSEDFKLAYAGIFEGDTRWQELTAPDSHKYAWSPSSTYIRQAPFFSEQKDNQEAKDLEGARTLLVLGDMVTTDHISPAGKFSTDQPAGLYLDAAGVESKDFNSYGSRRGNHEVMMRGTFANVRLQNKLSPQAGGYTRHFPSGELCSVYDAAMRYKEEGVPLVVFAGKDYGSGSSRDWAAKGTALLGIRAVVAESFERIHRSNLVGMGVLPVECVGHTISDLALSGEELISIRGLVELKPLAEVEIVLTGGNTAKRSGMSSFKGRLRLDSQIEVSYYRQGGILQHVMANFLSKTTS